MFRCCWPSTNTPPGSRSGERHNSAKWSWGTLLSNAEALFIMNAVFVAQRANKSLWRMSKEEISFSHERSLFSSGAASFSKLDIQPLLHEAQIRPSRCWSTASRRPSEIRFVSVSATIRASRSSVIPRCCWSHRGMTCSLAPVVQTVGAEQTNS